MAAPRCTFALNSQPISSLVCDGKPYAAFSGVGADTNNPKQAADRDRGPIPPGTYYIVARQSGGRLGWLWDWMHSHYNGYDVSRWFMLWRDNEGHADDDTLVQGVMRGQFRLHPIGPRRLSEGCITLVDVGQFDDLRQYLLAAPTAFVPGTNVRMYGIAIVK